MLCAFALLSPSTVSCWWPGSDSRLDQRHGTEPLTSVFPFKNSWLVQLAEAHILCNQDVLVLNLAPLVCRISSFFFSLWIITTCHCFQLSKKAKKTGQNQENTNKLKQIIRQTGEYKIKRVLWMLQLQCLT